MSSVDSRIVTMKFDNAKFQQGVGTTMNTLGKLKSSLGSLSGSAKGLDDVNNAAGRFHMGNMGGAVDGISKKFLALSTVAITAISNITNKAVDAGLRIGKSLTIQPIMDGFKEYETNLNSVQTVLANTKSEGATLKDVNKALAELNTYSDKTIYNFSEMAKNIGTFTAAGVDLKTSTASIKGIANLAAISGSTSDQASSAMYQLSQAIAAGKVGLQDWNSVVNAGMGGKTFQDALYRTGKAMDAIITIGSGKNAQAFTIDEWIKGGHSFRESLQSKWLTSDILTKTLQGFTGDLSKAQLQQMGYNKEQIKEIQQIGKTGQDAATKVKTMTQLMDTLREAVGSGWANTWQIIFGNFGEAKKTFTSVSNVLGAMIKRSANARNSMLKDWKKLGGRTVLIEAIGNAFQAIMRLIRPIRQAFRDVFPPMTGKRLYELTVILRDFTERLKMGAKTSDGVRRTFRGLFAIFSIGWTLLKNFVRYWVSLVGLIAGGSGSIFQFTGSLGDLLVKLQEWLVAGGKIDDFFTHVIEGRAALLKPIIDFVGKLVEAFAALISGGPQAFMEKLGVAFDALNPAIDAVKAAIASLGEWFHKTFPSLSGVVDNVKEALGHMVDRLVQAFPSLGPIIEGAKQKLQSVVDFVKNIAGQMGLGSLFDMGDSVSVAEAGIHGVGQALGSTQSVAEKIKSAWGGVVDAFKKVGEFLAPIWPAIQDIFTNLKNNLVGYVKGLGFDEGLSLVNTGFFIAFYIMLRNFIKNMKGLVEGAQGVLESASGVLDQVTKNLKTMQADVRADIILKIAGALALLAVAILVLSKIDSKNLGVALGAVAIMLTQLVVALKALERNASLTGAAQMTILSAALVALSVALLAMAAALAILGNMKLSTILKGLMAVSGILGVLIAATALLEKSGGAGQMLVAAGALLLLSAALTAMAGAMKLFSAIDTGTLVNGGLKIVAVLAGLGLAMSLFPPNVLATSASIFIVANALVVLAGALKLLGNLSGGEMFKSILTLALVLPILAAGMAAMTGTLTGAAAMLVMSAALIVMAGALKALGSLDISTIVIALAAIAGVFLVLGLAALILTPVVPVIFALAGAIALLGLAALAVGGGLLMFSAGLAALAATGAAGIAVLSGAVLAIGALIPTIMHQVGLGIIAFASVLAKSGPPMIAAFTTVLLSLLQAVINVTPKLGEALIVLIRTGLKVIRELAPDVVDTGYAIFMALLNGIAKNIGPIADTATKIIVNWINALAKNLPKIVDAGFKFIIKFINGITKAINDNSEAMGRAGGNLAVAIVNGMIKGLASAGGPIVKAARNLAGQALGAVADALGIHSPSREFAKLGAYSSQGLANGLIDNAKLVGDAGEGVAQTALDVITATMSRIPDALSEHVDMNPVITPVLDLTQLQNDATKIGATLPDKAITAGVSYGQAAAISADTQAAAQAAADATSATSTPTEIKFEQNNYSPKALTPIEVYRNTKSQLALAKEALNT